MPGQNPEDDGELERLKWARAEREAYPRGPEAKALDREIAAMEMAPLEEAFDIVEAKAFEDVKTALRFLDNLVHLNGVHWNSEDLDMAQRSLDTLRRWAGKWPSEVFGGVKFRDESEDHIPSVGSLVDTVRRNADRLHGVKIVSDDKLGDEFFNEICASHFIDEARVFIDLTRALLRTPTPEAREPEQELADEILRELQRARTKFPGDNVTMLALMEEVGELAKATFEESAERVRREAVQVATMAMRVVLDGDSTLNKWRAAKGLNPLTTPPGEDE